MIEQLWFRIIIIIFCCLLSFLVGCDKKYINTIEKGKVIIEIDKRDKENKNECEGGICYPPEGY